MQLKGKGLLRAVDERWGVNDESQLISPSIDMCCSLEYTCPSRTTSELTRLSIGLIFKEIEGVVDLRSISAPINASCLLTNICASLLVSALARLLEGLVCSKIEGVVL